MEPTICECLMKYTKKQMEDASFRLGQAPLAKSAKKAAWAAQIEKGLTEHRATFALQFSAEEWKGLQEFCKKSHCMQLDQPGEDMAAHALGAMLKLCRYGLAWIEDEKRLYVREGAEHLFDEDAHGLEVMQVNDCAYEMMQGLLWHFGMMPMDDVVDRTIQMMSNGEKLTDEQDDMMHAFCLNLYAARRGLDGLYQDDAGQIWLIHEELEDPDALYERLQAPYLARLPYPKVSREDALVCGHFDEPPGGDRLFAPMISWMMRQGLNEEEAQELVAIVVLDMQNGDSSVAMDSLMELMPEMRAGEIDKGLELLQNLLNGSPHWMNKGYTPFELQRHMLKPKGAPYSKPASPFADFPAPMQPSAPVKAAPMPGRNDPCPCGSGKKYKHCCGKRVN